MDDNTAQLFMGEDVVTVTLDEQGINTARMMMNNYYALNK